MSPSAKTEADTLAEQELQTETLPEEETTLLPEETVEETTEETSETSETSEEIRPDSFFLDEGNIRYRTKDDLLRGVIEKDRTIAERSLENREKDRRIAALEAKLQSNHLPQEEVKAVASLKEQIAALPNPNEDWEGYLKARQALDIEIAERLESNKPVDVKQVIQQVRAELNSEADKTLVEKDFDQLCEKNPDLYGLTTQDDIRLILSMPSHPDYQKAQNIKLAADYVNVRGFKPREAHLMVKDQAAGKVAPKASDKKELTPEQRLLAEQRRTRARIEPVKAETTTPPRREIKSLDDGIAAAREAILKG